MAELYRFLRLLICNIPQNLRLILTTRNSLPFAAELGAKGLLHRVGTETLAFRQEDIPAYCRMMGIVVTAEQAGELYSYSEGWISALYLFLRDYQQTGRFAFSSSIPELMDKTVYQPLTAEEKSFLLAVCLFDSFSMREAAAVWPHANAAESAEGLLSANAFLTRDGETGILSLHNLLRQCVRERFELLTEPEWRAAWRKTGEALFQGGKTMRALACFENAGDWGGVLRVIADSGHARDLYPEHKALYIRCYLACPAEKKRDYPLAALAFGMDMLTQFYEPALYRQAEADFCTAMAENTALSDDERRQLSGEHALLLSFSKFNDLFEMGAQNARAAALLCRPPRFVYTEDSFTFASPPLLYLYHREAGGLARLADYMNTAPGSYTKSTGGHGHDFMPMLCAERLYFMGDAENARIAAYQSTELARAAEQGDLVLCGLFLLARLALQSGNVDELRVLRGEIYRLSRRLSREHGAYWLLYTGDLCLAWLDLCAGNSDSLPDWLFMRDYPKYLPFVTISCADIVLGRALLKKAKMRVCWASPTRFYSRRKSFRICWLFFIFAFIRRRPATGCIGTKRR